MIAIPIYNSQGKSSDKMQLSSEIVRKEQSPRTFAVAIRALFQNWRQGTVGCKTRGELAFSNKKPWRQKGTGRARVSSIRSPLWRKGGVIFGPQPRVRELTLNKEHRKLVFNNLLFSIADAASLYCLDLEVANSKPSTRNSFNLLSNMSLGDKKIVVFLRHDDEFTFSSFRNLPNVHIVFFDQPNAYHLSNAKAWMFLKKDVELFKNMVAQWN